MAIFTLKYRDTRPILEVVLYDPDGSVHDLTGATAFNLNIRDGSTVFTRPMVKEGLDTAGTLRYSWADADWTGSPKLPAPPSLYPVRDLPMEYEVVSGTSRMTFPNEGHDTLRILGDIA